MNSLAVLEHHIAFLNTMAAASMDNAWEVLDARILACGGAMGSAAELAWRVIGCVTKMGCVVFVRFAHGLITLRLSPDQSGGLTTS